MSQDFAPISHYHDLVAGAGAPGFEDGAFYRARFHTPAGMVFDAKRSALFVSDRDNNRIRAIWLNENNRVSTLAGSGRAGQQDGAAQQATFNQPTAITAISDRLLLVNDEGNALFRVIDLETKSVSTLAGNGTQGAGEGPAGKVGLGAVWSLLFVPDEHAVYFSQPALYALRKLDLKSRMVKTVLQSDSRVPNPTALVLFQGKVCVADHGGQVFALFESGPDQPTGVEEQWAGSQILAMAASGDRLYALQAQHGRTWNCLSDAKDVPFPFVWGEGSSIPYLDLATDETAVVVADTTRERSFFVTSASLNSVLCWKDYGFADLSEASSLARNGLTDYAYPEKKPERTVRILLLGDSRLFDFDRGPQENGRQPGKMETIPKRLELMLNTLAALEGGDSRYEVLSLAKVSWEPILVWPNYGTAEIARRYDVDLILLMLPPMTTTLEAYLERPITAQGIPANQIDPEYLLKPYTEKMRGNPAASVIQRCQALGWFHLSEGGQVLLQDFSTLLKDPIARDELLRLFGRPLRQVREKFANGWQRRRAPSFAVCYFPVGSRGSGVTERSFWRELCRREGVSWLDLVDPLTVLEETWYPIAETTGYGHFTSNGHAVVAFVLAHELIRTGRIRLRRSWWGGSTVWIVSGGIVVVLVAAALAARRLRLTLRRASRS